MRFGTAGIPVSVDGSTLDGIKGVRELDLDAMEIEFVRNVYLKEDKTEEVKRMSEKYDVTLTCHAPYYINLNAKEKKKIGASKHRILQSAKITNLCGGFSVCFHPGYYLDMDKEKVYDNVKKEVKDMVRKLRDQGNEIWIRPETTGKPTQFGNIKELLRLSQEVEQVMPCIDFSHLHARTNGDYNSYEEFVSVLEEVEKTLGKKGLREMHIHVSGIEYGEKGEKNHLNLEKSDFNYKKLMKALKEFKADGVLISESPNIEKDALLMKNTYKNV